MRSWSTSDQNFYEGKAFEFRELDGQAQISYRRGKLWDIKLQEHIDHIRVKMLAGLRVYNF